MRSTHESFLLTEASARVEAGERRARLYWDLAELRRDRPSLRQRIAGRLVALAHRLSPEVAPFAKSASEDCVQT